MPRKVSSGRYQGRYYDQETRKHIPLGTFATEEEALRAELLYSVQLQAGLVPGKADTAKPRVSKGREPFAKYAERKLERVLQMPPEAVQALVALRETRDALPNEPVFLTVHGKQQSYNNFSLRFNKLKNGIGPGLEEMHAHDLRHIHLSEYAKHSTQAELMAHAGHTDHRSSMRYQHPDPIRQAEIVSRMSFA